MTEGALEGLVGQLGDLSGHLHTGRAGPDHGEGHQLAAPDRVAGTFGLFECAENAPAQFQGIIDGLHARGPFGEMVVSEVGLARSGRHDQAVIGR
ncbi:Uncharacterised protein [Mycobacteroides abscessus subsp. bolletii]|nr:Uncharacterised protein [Mycobacteroides abscessus subsp. bolletii]